MWSKYNSKPGVNRKEDKRLPSDKPIYDMATQGKASVEVLEILSKHSMTPADSVQMIATILKNICYQTGMTKSQYSSVISAIKKDYDVACDVWGEIFSKNDDSEEGDYEQDE
jgi:hypothetical protein